jgi:hypothetical protein
MGSEGRISNSPGGDRNKVVDDIEGGWSGGNLEVEIQFITTSSSTQAEPQELRWPGRADEIICSGDGSKSQPAYSCSGPLRSHFQQWAANCHAP